jgi:cysteine synthase
MRATMSRRALPLLRRSFSANAESIITELQGHPSFGAPSRISHGAGHGRRVYDNMSQMLSDSDNPTPLVKVPRSITGLAHATVYGKLEWYNPFGSVKDRVANSMLENAEDNGQLAGGELVEASSGNTAIGLAMLCNTRGIKFNAVMSNKIPAEKRYALRMFGAEVHELEDDL